MAIKKLKESTLPPGDRKVCEKFKHLIEVELHMTQAEAGEKLGLNQNTLSRIVRGVNAPSCSLIINILNTFDVNPYWFLLDKDEAVFANESKRYRGKQIDKQALKEIADDVKEAGDRLRKMLK